MQCPTCNNTLVEYDAGDFKVDICRDGCAGIWLDKSELERCNQHNEKFNPDLLRVKRNADVVIDRNKKRSCPKCSGSVLMRIELDKESDFEIDFCPACEGHWLDIGELERMRSKDKENSEIATRMKVFEEKIAAALKDPHTQRNAQAFVKLLFK